MSPHDVDVLIVGSGASAVHAAWPLVEAGLRVRMLDFGNRDERYAELVPPVRFDELRRTDARQHRYLLGDRFEGVAFGPTGSGAQLTPPRQFVTRDAARWLPVDSADFFPLQSLALGGLAEAWGAGCPPFAESDLADLPLDLRALAPHYEKVAERIGVSGDRDDTLEFFGELRAMLPPLRIDENAESVLRRYDDLRSRLNRDGFHLGRPRLAVLSREHRGRGPTGYRDLEFWSDADRSVYRPRYTVDELARHANFEYRRRLFVERFDERSGRHVEVTARCVRSGRIEVHAARRVVLAAGTLSTVRIVARSLGAVGREFPLVCNPHTYVPLLNLSMLGRPASHARHSLAQLCCIDAPDGPDGATTVGHLYPYRSLMLFRLIRDVPLPVPESVGILRGLLSALSVLILQHADRPSSGKACRLDPGPAGSPGSLHVRYELTRQERHAADRVERRILRRFRRLGCVGLRRVRPGAAASIHYAGTLPMRDDEQAWTTDTGGRLRGTESVHVVDGSVFPCLPSRGLTFTMMANADRVGHRLRETLA